MARTRRSTVRKVFLSSTARDLGPCRDAVYQAISGMDGRREREELLAATQHNAGVRSLAANPLLLTILAVMKRQGVTLPERRVEFCRVPAGPFRMGSAEDDEQAWDDEKPAHEVDLPYDYSIGKYPVTGDGVWP